MDLSLEAFRKEMLSIWQRVVAMREYESEVHHAEPKFPHAAGTSPQLEMLDERFDLRTTVEILVCSMILLFLSTSPYHWELRGTRKTYERLRHGSCGF